MLAFAYKVKYQIANYSECTLGIHCIYSFKALLTRTSLVDTAYIWTLWYVVSSFSGI